MTSPSLPSDFQKIKKPNSSTLVQMLDWKDDDDVVHDDENDHDGNDENDHHSDDDDNEIDDNDDAAFF